MTDNFGCTGGRERKRERERERERVSLQKLRALQAEAVIQDRDYSPLSNYSYTGRERFNEEKVASVLLTFLSLSLSLFLSFTLVSSMLPGCFTMPRTYDVSDGNATWKWQF